MTTGFGSNSSQAFLMASVQGTAGSTVEVVDSSGKAVASLKASKSFSTVLISSPDIKDGEKYTIKVGSNSTQQQLLNKLLISVADLVAANLDKEVREDNRAKAVDLVADKTDKNF